MSLFYNNSEFSSLQKTFQQMEFDNDSSTNNYNNSSELKLLSLQSHSIHIVELINNDIRKMYEEYLFPMALNEVEIWKAESFSSLSSYHGWIVLNNLYDGIYISYDETTTTGDDKNKGCNRVRNDLSNALDVDNAMECSDTSSSSSNSTVFSSSTSCFSVSSSDLRSSFASSSSSSRPCVSSSAIILSPKLKGTFSVSWENNEDGGSDLAMIAERLITIFTSNAQFRSILEEKMISNEFD
jgi:hypothetical protein